MSIKFQKVQVASSHTVDPLPGVLVKTDEGDVIVVYEEVSQTIGLHGPADMAVEDISAIAAQIAKEATEAQEFPFTADEKDAMIWEESFLFLTLEV